MTDQDPKRDSTRDRPDEPTGTDPATAMMGDPTVTADQAPAHPAEPVLPEVAASLTDALRAMYDNVVDEPLPDAFAHLLSQLDDSDA